LGSGNRLRGLGSRVKNSGRMGQGVFVQGIGFRFWGFRVVCVYKKERQTDRGLAVRVPRSQSPGHLQCVAVCCSVFAVRCSALQCVAALCGALQCVAVWVVVCCSGLQYVAVCSDVVQHVAACCSILQKN